MGAAKPLELDEAIAVVGPYFEAARAAYLERGFDRVGRTRLIAVKAVHDSARHFARCRDDGLQIEVAPEMADLAEDELTAILAHELGHASDFLYPADFQLRSGELLRWRERPEDDERGRFNRMRQWEKRDTDSIELTADAIASFVFGRSIRYAGPCLLQSFERGIRPRPLGLR